MEKGCPGCGRMIDSNLQICPYCKYNFENLNKVFKKYEEQDKPLQMKKHAGFIQRIAAFSVDNFLFGLIYSTILISFMAYSGVLNLLRYTSIKNYIDIVDQIPNAMIFILILLISYPILYLLYCSYTQSHRYMGTLGERLVGIEVVDENDDSLTFGQAFKRNIARILNYLTLGIGTLMIIFTKKKQALSDIVSHTYATNRIPEGGINRLNYASGGIRILAWVLDLGFLAAYNFVLINVYKFLSLIEVAGFVGIIYPILLWIILLIGGLFALFYFPIMESKKGATVGKMMCGLKVTKLDGERVGFFRALLRFILNAYEGLIVFGKLLVFVTPRHQTIKDIITKTVVISRR